MGEEQPGMLNGKEKSKNIKTKKNAVSIQQDVIVDLRDGCFISVVESEGRMQRTEE